MQLLVFAHTPPPLHGQSMMVQTLIEGLPSLARDIGVHHVNPQLSRDSADIGRWRPGKLVLLLRACAEARRLQRQHSRMTFYYVPAPAKRPALYRDLLVMLLCRRSCDQLVLHWHAVGLGEWLAQHATTFERWLARKLLGRADLAVVLAPELAADAESLAPQRVAVVPNGIPDLEVERVAPNALRAGEPATPLHHGRDARATTHVLFLGLCSREKGLFDTLTAIALANHRVAGGFHLTVAGNFATTREEHAFRAGAKALGRNVVRYVGFASAEQKRALLSEADVLCFPTFYAHEGQPLVLLEALAADLPIITTRWRAIPSMLPKDHVWRVEPHEPDQIADALLAVRVLPPPSGQLRAHFLAHFTRERHLTALAGALYTIA